jgi:hypothetical protein
MADFNNDVEGESSNRGTMEITDTGGHELDYKGSYSNAKRSWYATIIKNSLF